MVPHRSARSVAYQAGIWFLPHGVPLPRTDLSNLEALRLMAWRFNVFPSMRGI